MVHELARIVGTSCLYDRDRTLRIWDPNSGTMLRILEGHGAEVVCVAVLAVTDLVANLDPFMTPFDNRTVIDW